MRFATVDDRLVLLTGDVGSPVLDVERASDGRLPADPLAALARWDDVLAWAAGADTGPAQDAPAAGYGPPVPYPRQVFAIALNYRPHADEAGFAAPDEPLVFTKFPSCIAGPDVEVRLPAGNVDWEIEVVAVIGRGGRDVTREQAWDAVAGVTLGQDLSERLQQLAGRPPQFALGKSHAGFGPIGPVLVTPDEFPDRDDIGFEAHLGDELVQHGRTAQMIFGVPELVARLSAVCELLPGDLIFTGTPAGVGNRRTPPRFLQRGETLVSHLEHVGEIRQRFV